MSGGFDWPKGLITLVAVWLSCGAELASQPVPPAADPGTIGRRFEPPPEPRAKPAPVVIEQDDQATPPPGAQETSFFLETVELEGNDAISNADLAPIIERYTGREIKLSELWDLRAAITVHYRNQGYILSRALVPEQEIADGIAHLVIIEGYVDRVTIEGNPTGDKGAIDHAIEKITESRPLTAAVLERYMLLLNDLAGVNAVSVLRPSPVAEGASELFIVWTEQSVSGALSLDNYGTSQIGPAQAYGTVTLANLYGRHDSTELLGALSLEVDELQYLSLEHSLPLDNEGTIAAFSATLTKTNAGERASLGGLDLAGDSLRVAATVSHALIRSRSQNLTLSGAVKLHNSETDDSGSPLTRDKIRAATLSASYDLVDRFRGINLFGVDLVQGFDILGARGAGNIDPTASRAGANPDFTKIAGRFTREQYLAPNLSLRLGGELQYGFDELLAAEEFGFGGANIGRGFDPYALAGDSGYAATAQLQYGRNTDLDYIESYEVFAFVDQGTVWRIDNANRDGRASAASVGVGVDFNTPFRVFGSLILAKPIDSAEGKDKDLRLLFRLSKRF